MNCPIVFVHSGNQEYLQIAINTCLDQGLDVYLLGDLTNKLFCKKWIDSNKIPINTFVEFEIFYQHLSSNRFDFELFCFKRYFLLYGFMNYYRINEVIMLDSDVLVYTDFSEYDLKGYISAISTHKRQKDYRWSSSPHCTFWIKTALSDFINFCITMYRDKIHVLKEKYQFHRENNVKGGVCDMTLLYLWAKDRKDVFNFAEVYKGGTIDNTISSNENLIDNEYKMWRFLRIKNLHHEKGKGYYFITKKNQKIFARLLHCQGAAKNLMMPLYEVNISKVKLFRFKYLLGKVLHLCLRN